MHTVVLSGKVLENYLLKRYNIKPGKPIPEIPNAKGRVCLRPVDVQAKCLSPPRARSASPRRSTASPCLSTLASYEHHGYYWRNGPTPDMKKRLGKGDITIAELVPKLAAIATSIARDPERRRTCVILHQESGYAVLQQLLGDAGVPFEALMPVGANKTVSTKNEAKLLAYNAPGSTLRVILLTAEQHSEGVSLQRTRRIILGDLSPGNERPRWTLVQQRLGRALRMCSHAALPPDERRLDLDLYVAVLPPDVGTKGALTAYPPTLDEEKLTLVRAERDSIQAALGRLRAVSIDAAYYTGEAEGVAGAV